MGAGDRDREGKGEQIHETHFKKEYPKIWQAAREMVRLLSEQTCKHKLVPRPPVDSEILEAESRDIEKGRKTWLPGSRALVMGLRLPST